MTRPRNPAETVALLAQWRERGWLRELDVAFARFLALRSDNVSPLVILAAALASHQLGRGHVCLTLAATLADPRFALSLPPDDVLQGDALLLPDAVLDGVDVAEWRAALARADVVDTVAAAGRADADADDGAAPLVLCDDRLYLRRYWRYEKAVRAQIRERSVAPSDLVRGCRASAPEASHDESPDAVESAAAAEADLHARLDCLFPALEESPHVVDWQKVACALAVRHRFSVVTGGPGTGKTTTVVKLLALLQSLRVSPAQGAEPVEAAAHPYRIRLAAPTGKAAARLNESMGHAIAQLPWSALPGGAALRALVPAEVGTLHRLLGTRPDSRRFRHGADHPLPVDVLVIDEASMIDLEMMAAVLAALPPTARLIMLGDKDQLASVEAGAVLGELCRHAAEGRYTEETARWLTAVTGERIDAGLIRSTGQPLDQCVATLRRSYRFTAESGIGRLAEAVNAGSVSAVRRVWSHGYADLARHALQTKDTAAAWHGFDDLVLDGAAHAFPAHRAAEATVPAAPATGYRHYLTVLRDGRPQTSESGSQSGSDDSVAEAVRRDDWARSVLQAYARFQLLTALRRGPFGVEGLNQRIARTLTRAGLIDAATPWYAGRPVLVTRNDYGLDLMNGDVGIALPFGADGALRVAFLSNDGSKRVRWILPSRLQAVETVFAMTVHKSQGSEFDHAALLLPPALNPILTRELIYTGITRARNWFSLVGTGRGDDTFERAIARRVQRASGLL